MKNDMSDRWPVLEVAMMINLMNIQPFFFEFLKSQHPEISIFRTEFKSENFWHITFYENRNWQVLTSADTTVTSNDTVTRQEEKSDDQILSNLAVHLNP